MPTNLLISADFNTIGFKDIMGRAFFSSFTLFCCKVYTFYGTIQLSPTKWVLMGKLYMIYSSNEKARALSAAEPEW